MAANSERNTQDPRGLVPRYVLQRDNIARRSGLHVERARFDDKHLLRTTWRGTVEQFVSTEVFEAKVRPSSRMEGNAFIAENVPSGVGVMKRNYVAREDGSTFVVTLDDDLPIAIHSHKNRKIEVLEMSPADDMVKTTAYHGPVEALLAEGLVSEKQVPRPAGKRPRYSKGSCSWREKDNDWHAQLLLDGSLLFTISQRKKDEETESAAPPRRAPMPLSVTETKREALERVQRKFQCVAHEFELAADTVSYLIRGRDQQQVEGTKLRLNRALEGVELISAVARRELEAVVGKLGDEEGRAK